MTAWTDWLAVERGLSVHSVAAYRRDARRWARWCNERGLGPDDATPADFSSFLESLAVGEDVLAPSSVKRLLAAARSFHRFSTDEGLVDSDPTESAAAPRLPRPVPKALDEAEVAALLAVPSGDTPSGLRDSAILELLYGTGMRIGELCALDVDDIDRERKQVIVFGKGRKERVVPLGRHAEAALDQWFVRGRPQFSARGAGRGSPAAFLNARGGRLTRQGAWERLRGYGDRIGLGDRLSPHVLRHSCATHMLEHGADIRVVQELLGHATIATTQVYTRVSQRRLHEVYLASHPRARAAGRHSRPA